jgi:hypothetical protein
MPVKQKIFHIFSLPLFAAFVDLNFASTHKQLVLVTAPVSTGANFFSHISSQ